MQRKILSLEKVAHRGYSSKYPENTELAFKKALEYPITMIETDLSLTRDGTWIIYHDESLTRLYGKEVWVRDCTEKEIKTISKNKIMTLEEFLKFIDGRCKLYLDIKNHPDLLHIMDLLTMIEQACQSYHFVPEMFYLASFNHNIINHLLRLRKNNSLFSNDLKIGFIGYLYPEMKRHYVKHLDFISTSYDLVNPEYIQDLMKSNQELLLFTYTCNDMLSLNHFRSLGARGLLTDSPKLFESF